MEAGSVLNLAQLTSNQPFCAGVLVFQGDALVITLNADGIPEGISEPTWRIGGVGGGQEPGETIWQCAAREAREEIGVDVQLRHSPVSYFHDRNTRSIFPVRVQDDAAPFLIERIANPSPFTPYKPGLPTGPHIYIGLFLGELLAPETMTPGDDVEGLVFLPLRYWEWLHQGVSVNQLADRGIRIESRGNVQATDRLWLPSHESLNAAVPLMRKHPELFGEATIGIGHEGCPPASGDQGAGTRRVEW